MLPITTPAPILATALALLLVACTFDRASLRAARDGQAEARDGRSDALDAPIDAETDGPVDAPASESADLPSDGPPPPAFGCPADTTLRLCFTLDEGAGIAVKDGSSFMNNGSTDAKWVAGISGSALEFDDGTKKVTAPDAPSLNLPGPEATFEAWVKPMTFPTDSNVDFVIAKRAMDASGFLFGVYKGGIYLCNAGSACCSAGVLPVGAWTHIAAVSDATGRRLYQDGAQVGVGSSCPTPLAGTSNAAPLTIGNASAPAANLGFRGAIDVVRVYARAKSPAEICADANRTWTGSACGGGSDGGADATDTKPEAPSCPDAGEVCGKTNPCVRTCRDTIDCARMCMSCSEIDGCKALLTDAAEKKKADDYWTCACSTCFDKCGDAATCKTCVCAELCTTTGKCATVGKACFGGTDPKTSNPECGFWGC